MSERVGEIVLQGIAASRGLAIGPVALRRGGRLLSRVAGTPAEEHGALTAAMAQARAQLEALTARAEPMAAAILEFQTALLEDDDLTGPIFDRIAAGEAADRAWADVLDSEIAEYAAGDDETFAARAGDLADLRDRVLEALAPGAPAQRGNGADHAIFAAEDLTPSRFLETDWTRYCGAALKAGSPAGHVALLARSRGTPLVVGLGDAFEGLADGALAVLDGEAGRLIINPDAATLSTTEARLRAAAAQSVIESELLDRPATTAEGERVLVLVNVDDPALLATLDPRHCDGVGLTRTEFLFRGADLPDEETQFRAYAEVLRWAAGRPVIIRTLDAGGDKPISGLTPDGERNPFLGLRGLRLSLARQDVFRVQLRALARAAAQGPLKVMAPMVSAPDEFSTFRAVFEDVLEELFANGVAAARPALGMMVEVPAAALKVAAFSADFFSIGSNDLIQYVMAASRDEPAVADLYRPRDSAVLELIRRVVEVGEAQGKEISLCGEMASDPALIPLLLAAGLRRLSVAPAATGAVKAAIAAWRPEASESGRHG
jgi:phosphoenolpyruvate-protein phosphotransferase (PTS system enzyme I)